MRFLKYYAVKTYSDFDLALIVELRCRFLIFSRVIAEYSSYPQAAAVAKRLNKSNGRN